MLRYSLSLLLLATSLVSAHGYLSSPPPRGIEKEAYNIDALKSPNTKGLCRGEPVGTITRVRPGQDLTLGLTITAPHTGPCRVTILDENLQNERPVAEKYDCAAPGKVEPWIVKLPSGVSGRAVLRWYWEGRHASPAEPYEQCIDLDFGGGNSSPAAQPQEDQPKPKRRQASTTARRHSEPAPFDGEPEARAFSHPVDSPLGSHSADNEEPAPDAQFTPASEPAEPVDDSADNSSNDNDNDGPSYEEASSDDAGSSCTHGSYKCSQDGGFLQCNHESWVKMSCSPGTKCRAASPTAIICDWA